MPSQSVKSNSVPPQYTVFRDGKSAPGTYLVLDLSDSASFVPAALYCDAAQEQYAMAVRAALNAQDIPPLWSFESTFVRSYVSRALDVQARSLDAIPPFTGKARVRSCIGEVESCRHALVVDGDELVVVENTPPSFVGTVKCGSSQSSFSDRASFTAAFTAAMKSTHVARFIMAKVHKLTDPK